MLDDGRVGIVPDDRPLAVEEGRVGAAGGADVLERRPDGGAEVAVLVEGEALFATIVVPLGERLQVDCRVGDGFLVGSVSKKYAKVI